MTRSDITINLEILLQELGIEIVKTYEQTAYDLSCETRCGLSIQIDSSSPFKNVKSFVELKEEKEWLLQISCKIELAIWTHIRFLSLSDALTMLMKKRHERNLYLKQT